MWLLHRFLFTLSILLLIIQTTFSQNVVTTLEDWGGGSLRYAINSVWNNDTITFKPGLSGTINLTDDIGHNLVIKGPGAGIIKINGTFTIAQSIKVTIIGLTFTGNNSIALINNNSSTLNLINCSITGLTRIGIKNNGNLYLTGCTINNNSNAAQTGSDIFAGILNAGGSAVLLNCTISGNYKSGITATSFSSLSILNCTITKNSKGGIQNLSSTPINIQNTIAAQNSNSGAIADVAGLFNSQGYNLVGVSDGTNGFINGSKGDLVGTFENPRNPKLGPLQDNGGFTFTHALLLGSPAIDTDADILSQTDQRGFPRPFHGRADIGAFEVSEHELIVTNLDDSGFGSLRNAIQYIGDPFYYTHQPIITFRTGLNGTINLQSDLIIYFDTKIEGPGADIITVSGRSIIVGPEAIMTGLDISGLTIANGGGINHYGQHNTRITNCTLRNNIHGAYCSSDGTLKIYGSTVSNNSQQGILADGITTIENSTVSGNLGPGISNHANLVMKSCTISDNKNYGIVNSGSFTASINNTIIAKNTNSSGAADVSGKFASQGYNLVGVCDAANGFTNGVNHDITGSQSTPLDPKLGPLQNNGGTTFTHALLAGSPAIDAGDCTGLTTDQRGVTRPVNGICDIGAFESDLTQPISTCPDGMIAYWKLDESSGLIYPNSFGSLNIASATAQNAPIPVPGKVGYAQQFNGSTTKINVPANAAFDFSARSSFSVEFWYKGSIIPQTVQTAIGRYIPQTGARWFVGINALDGKAKFYVTEGGASAAAVGSVITDGNWHHVAATRNGTTKSAKIYVDGESKGQTNIDGIFSNGFISSSANLNIGWLSFQNECSLNGSLDEVAYYNIELPAAEIKQHYINGLSGQGYCSGSGVAPVITSVPDTTGDINQLYTFDVNATGVPASKYSLIRSPYGMTIDSITGIIRWTPSAAGRFLVTVEAHNYVYPPARLTYTLNISDLTCPPEMVSYWKLDETTPGKYDDYISAYNGNSSSAPTPVAGIVGGAQQFNGRNTQINIPANPSFDFGPKRSIFIEFWYKGTEVPTIVQTIIGRYIPETNTRWFIGINKNDGRIMFYISHGVESTSLLGDPVVDGSWHHVVVSTNISITVDDHQSQGKGMGEFTSIDFTSLTANLNIGWLNFPNAGYLQGMLDEVAIYNTRPRGITSSHYYNGLSGIGYCGGRGTAPKFTSTPVTTGAVGSLYTYDANATGDPVPTYSLISYEQTGMSIDPITGIIKWTPSSAGSYSVDIEAHNGVAPPVHQRFKVLVTDFTTCPSSLISYWKLDETTTGTYKDYIGGNNAISNSPPVPVSGKVGGAQQFDGKNAKISVPANPIFDFGVKSSFSIEFWYTDVAYLDPPYISNTYKSVIGRYIPATGAKWFVGTNPEGNAIFYMSSGGISAAVIGYYLYSWSHIVATRNGTNGVMKIYIDGYLRDSTMMIFKTGFTSPTASLNIGWLSAQNDFALHGWLDEVAIYNAELSPSDIFRHYRKGSAGYSYCSSAGLAKDGVELENAAIPSEYKLNQNFPNPFNPVTTISYQLPITGFVELKMYDVLGNEVAILVNEEKPAGIYNVKFDGSNLASGIYFYKIKAGEYISVKKLLLLK